MERLFAAQRNFGAQLGADAVEGLMVEIDRANWRRLRIFFGLTVLYEILLVVLVDLPSYAVAKAGLVPPGPGAPLGAGEAPRLPLAFLACHLGILLASGLGLLAAFLNLSRQPRSGATRGLGAVPTLGPGLIPMAILMVLGIVASLDQLRGGDISAFTINIVVASLLLYLRPPVTFLVFTPGFALMMAGVATLQPEASVRLGHLVNGGIFYTAVLLLSAYLFNNQFSQLAKSILIERAAATIQDLSLHDELTGHLNRRAFQAIVERELPRMRREGRKAFLAIGDIDHFKHLNDSHGHPGGDAVLKAVASVLGASLRATDAVARWGGEEFILLLEDGDAGTTREVLERARRAVEALRVDHEGEVLACTLCLGFSEIDPRAEGAFDEAYRRADAALYRAKAEGRNRIAPSPEA